MRGSAELLDVRGVSRSFWTGGLLSRRRVDAVRDVSFNLTADKPEIFTIIGESGSGKSTLARMILNSMSPTAGSIRFGGEDLETSGRDATACASWGRSSRSSRTRSKASTR